MSWRELHSLSTNIIMVLMGLHVALHWNWIVNMFKKMIPAQRPVSQVVHPKPVLSLRNKEARS
jgi:hypothetical protein